MGRVILMENHRPTCSVAGCSSPVQTRASGLCIMHNARMKRHGSTDDPRPEGYGEKKKHPLWLRWAKFKNRGLLCAEWLDFGSFVAGVSPAPDRAKKLARRDDSKPYGPDNFIWLITPTRDETLAYYRAWNKANPHARRAKHLADKYDITIPEYDAMHAAQGARCAICNREEQRPDNQRRGLKRKLAVDHDHKTGMVRDLLCGNCNTMIGEADEDSARLFAAIQYLAKWGKVQKVS
jgi:Recombination endonuclease VII